MKHIQGNHSLPPPALSLPALSEKSIPAFQQAATSHKAETTKRILLNLRTIQRARYHRTDCQIRKLRREVLRQLWIRDEWFDRRLDFPSFESRPLNLSEKPVALDALHVFRHASAQPFLRLFAEKAREEVFCVRAE